MSGAIEFAKGHALGNDYIVIEAAALAGGGVDQGGRPRPEWIRSLCDRRFGVGGDGLLLVDPAPDPVRLRIFNPDGTEAEKSGNGLRILGAYLHGRGRVGSDPFAVDLPGERVEMRVDGPAGGGGLAIGVAMGRPSFAPADIGFVPSDDVGAAAVAADPAAAADPPPGAAPTAGATDAAGPTSGDDPDLADPAGGADSSAGDEADRAAPAPVRLTLENGTTVHVQPVSTGNPHCVVFVDELRREMFERVAPRLARHPAFRAGANVQFARIAAPAAVEAWVWERGAGETLASGSSACAVVAAARLQGRLPADDAEVEVRMPGGTLAVGVGADGGMRLRGPAQILYRGELRGAVAAAWTDDAAAGGGGPGA